MKRADLEKNTYIVDRCVSTYLLLSSINHFDSFKSLIILVTVTLVVDNKLAIS